MTRAQLSEGGQVGQLRANSGAWIDLTSVRILPLQVALLGWRLWFVFLFLFLRFLLLLANTLVVLGEALQVRVLHDVTIVQVLGGNFNLTLSLRRSRSTQLGWLRLCFLRFLLDFLFALLCFAVVIVGVRQRWRRQRLLILKKIAMT